MRRCFYFVLLEIQTFYISLTFLPKERSVQIPDVLQMRTNKNRVIHICSSYIIKPLGKISLGDEEVIGGLMLRSPGTPWFGELSGSFE